MGCIVISSEEYLSVFQFNKAMESHFKNNSSFMNVHVKGEVSGKYISEKNHLYFTLKDKRSKVPCIVYSWFRKNIEFEIEDGMKLLVIANVSVYPPHGKYQLDIRHAVEDGLGQLYIKYRQLKKKLEKEGLFSNDHKKELPHFPKHIGVITSPGGSVIHDIIKTINKNWPYCHVFIFPASVQGANSKKELVEQIKKADNSDMDVLIIARGGGSLEELWAYNEEELVRTVFKCSTPVISAVGHEDDVTLCDLVSDKRASTPTMAAGMAVEDKNHILSNINHYNTRLITFVSSKIDDYEKQLNFILSKSVFADKTYVYKSKADDFDDLCNRFEIVSESLLNSNRVMLNKITNEYVIRNPCKMQVDSSKSNLNDCKVRLLDAMNNLLKDSEVNLDKATNKFKFLSDKLISSRKHDLDKVKSSSVIVRPCEIQWNNMNSNLILSQDKLIKSMDYALESNQNNLEKLTDKFRDKSNQIMLTNTYRLNSVRNSPVIRNHLKGYVEDNSNNLDDLSSGLEKSFNLLVKQNQKDLDMIINKNVIRNPEEILESYKSQLNKNKEKLDKIKEIIDLKKAQQKQKATLVKVIVAIVVVFIIIIALLLFGGK